MVVQWMLQQTARQLNQVSERRLNKMMIFGETYLNTIMHSFGAVTGFDVSSSISINDTDIIFDNNIKLNTYQ